MPVLDATLTAAAYAEYLADLAHRFGWRHSKKAGYQAPPTEEMSWLPPARGAGSRDHGITGRARSRGARRIAQT